MALVDSSGAVETLIGFEIFIAAIFHESLLRNSLIFRRFEPVRALTFTTDPRDLKVFQKAQFEFRQAAIT